MEPADYDLTMYRGTFGARGAVVFSFFDGTGAIIPITGLDCLISATSGAYKLRKMLSAGALIADTIANTITWFPTRAEVAAIPQTGVPWFVELTWPDGSGQRVIEGTLTGKGL